MPLTQRIGLGVLLLALLAFMYKAAERSTTSDFRRYYTAGTHVLAGENIYQNAGTAIEFKYLPFFAQIMGGFARLPILPAACLWYLLVAGGYVGMILLAYRFFHSGTGTMTRLDWGALLLVALGTGRFFVDNARLGQLNTPVAFLAVAGAYSVLTGREKLGGILTALGAILKFMPALLILYYLYKRRWVAGGTALATLLVCLLFIPALTWGWQGNLDLLKEYVGNRSKMVTEVPKRDAPGQSVPALLNRLLREDVIAATREGPEDIHLLALDRRTVKRLASAAVLLLLLLFAWKVRRPWGEQAPLVRGLEVGLILLLMLLISPEARRPHFITLVWPLMAVVRLTAGAARETFRRERLLTYAATLAILGTSSDLIGRTPAAYLAAYGIILFAALALTVACWRLHNAYRQTE